MTKLLLRGYDLQTQIEGIASIGAPFIELKAHVEDSFIDSILPLKKAFQILSYLEWEALVNELRVPFEQHLSGGAMTVAVINAKLASRSYFIGKLGIDPFGSKIYRLVKELGVVGFFAVNEKVSTSTLLTLITPTNQFQVMHLGASSTLCAQEIKEMALHNIKITYFEGYSVSQSDFCQSLMAKAKSFGSKVALSLSNPHYVLKHLNQFRSIIFHYVDYLLADFAQIKALTGMEDFDQMVSDLSSLVSVLLIRKDQTIIFGFEGSIFRYELQQPLYSNEVEQSFLHGIFLYFFRTRQDITSAIAFVDFFLQHAREKGFDLTKIDWQLIINRC
jgi:sugar/nucleoside kinase (ribokinase family)